MNMELFAFLLMFVMLWKPSWSLLCYKCDPEPVDNEYITLRSCEHFDYSQKYEVNCDASTMCFKRITQLTLDSEVTTMSVHRGCAPQTMSGDQQRINGKWRPVKNIYEVYDETCSEDPNDSERITKTTNCYCRGDYCNNAHRTAALSVFTILLGLLVTS